MRAHHFNATSLVVPWLLVGTVSADAQSRPGPIEEIRAPEAFVHIGGFRAGSDEGKIGNGISYGGALTLPFSPRLAVDLDIQTARVINMRSPDNFYTTRRTLIVPSLLYRFGLERVYGFLGGGIGAELERSVYREDKFRPEFRPVDQPLPAGWHEVRPGVFELNQSDVGRITSFRGGVAAFPIPRLGLRGDVYMAGWHLGARIGIGYRF